jgi:hypothetical protein
MSNIITTAGGCCCRYPADRDPRDSVTVPAGSVGTGLSACGIETELSRLPQTIIKPQSYREGFCPDEAIDVGTLFPELADNYK